jgi:hypothetical protein
MPRSVSRHASTCPLPPHPPTHPPHPTHRGGLRPADRTRIPRSDPQLSESPPPDPASALHGPLRRARLRLRLLGRRLRQPHPRGDRRPARRQARPRRRECPSRSERGRRAWGCIVLGSECTRYAAIWRGKGWLQTASAKKGWFGWSWFIYWGCERGR